MTTLHPRPPYSQEELDKLYPRGLQLEQVQVVLRHGERTPVTPRFQNTGLPPYWAYCHAAKRLTAAVIASDDISKWDKLEYNRRLESFGLDDMPAVARGPKGEVDGICLPGELTDQGRETTRALGQRLRHLYVDQLRFLPDTLTSASLLHLRSTPIPRALESTQQAFYGLYPSTSRSRDCPTPTITARAINEEILFPNEGACKRFSQLAHAFADRVAQTWNSSPEMNYINSKLSKYMPPATPKVAVDGKPRLSGIMDTLNSTLGHGGEVRLPKEFHDPKVRQNIDMIASHEWFDGYKESREYRMLGVGSLAAEMTSRMCKVAEANGQRGSPTAQDSSEQQPKLYIAGSHDTTLAGTLTSLGAFGSNPWPPYSSHIAVELFSDTTATPTPASAAREPTHPAPGPQNWLTNIPIIGTYLSSSTLQATASAPPNLPSTNPAHARTRSLSPHHRESLQTHYVRIRYNDVPVIIPGCKPKGNHWNAGHSATSSTTSGSIKEGAISNGGAMARGGVPSEGGAVGTGYFGAEISDAKDEGDASFCTLAAFREIVEGFAPKDWRGQCRENLGEGIEARGEEAGWPAAIRED